MKLTVPRLPVQLTNHPPTPEELVNVVFAGPLAVTV